MVPRRPWTHHRTMTTPQTPPETAGGADGPAVPGDDPNGTAQQPADDDATQPIGSESNADTTEQIGVDATEPIGTQPDPGAAAGPARSDDVTAAGDSPPPPPRDEATAPPPHNSPPPPLQDPTPPPPPSDPPPPGGGGFNLSMGGRQLYRRADDRVVAGVASGLGDFFGLDPAIVRVIFVGLAIFGGSGFLLYLLGWLFIPTPGTKSIGDGLLRKVGGPRSAGGIAILVVATIVVLDSVSNFGGGPLLAAVLIGAGVLLYRNENDGGGRGGTADGPGGPRPNPGRGTAPDTPGPTPVPPPPATDASAQPMSDPYIAYSPSMAAAHSSASTTIPPEVYDELPPPPPGLYDDDEWRPTPQPPPPEAPPPASILGRLTFAAALILVGVVALFENLTPLEVSAASYAAMALTVLGAGLIVGAKWGRARGLIALGLVAILGLTTASVLPAIPGNGVGERRYVPQTVADLRQPYELTAGEMIIDLTELELTPGQVATVDATMGVGSLQVVVPEGVGIRGDAFANVGAIDVLDDTNGGPDTNVSFSEPADEGSATIDVDLRTGVGEIDIRRDTTEGTS
ncbi:hypothetical protein BH23ACT10_BH23ACT10_21430 [soil metagenome]